jgi:DNA-3-methyladenine glycosylase
LGIDGHSNGVDLLESRSGLRLVDDGVAPPAAPGRSARIGISVAQEKLWRFFVPGHAGLSGSRVVNVG